MKLTPSGRRGQSKPAAAEIDSYKRLIVRFLPARPIFLFEFADLIKHRSGRSVAGDDELRLRGLHFPVAGLDPNFVVALRSLARDGLIEIRPEGPPGGATVIVAASYRGPRRGAAWEKSLYRRSDAVRVTLSGAWKR